MRSPPTSAKPSFASSCCAAAAAASASALSSNAAQNASPTVLNVCPRLVSIARRTIASCRSTAERMASPCRSHRCVLPSMSVKRKVTEPVGMGTGISESDFESAGRCIDYQDQSGSNFAIARVGGRRECRFGLAGPGLCPALYQMRHHQAKRQYGEAPEWRGYHAWLNGNAKHVLLNWRARRITSGIPNSDRFGHRGRRKDSVRRRLLLPLEIE